MNFEVSLSLTGAASQFEIRVLNPRWAAGAAATSVIPFSADEVKEIREKINFHVATGSPLPDRYLNEVGHRLFNALFVGEVRDDLMRCVGRTEEQAERSGPQEPLRVIIQADGEQLEDQPWELLYYARRDCFLALRAPFTLTRSVATPVAFPVYPQVVYPPIRIAFLVSAPKDQANYGFQPISREEMQREVELVRRAVRKLNEQGLIECIEPARPGIAAFLDLVRGPEPVHVVHLIGHGDYRDGKGLLLLEDEQETGLLRETSWLREQIYGPSLRLVVLNCCKSALPRGLARALARAGIPAVVGLQFDVSEEFAEGFSAGFYTRLATEPMATADVCTREARLAGMRAVRRDSTPEWASPVLITTLGEVPLFDLRHAGPGPTGLAAPTPPGVFDGRSGNYARASFRGRQHLIGADFSHANLTEADFSGANLTAARFTGALMVLADLRGAVLQGADLTGANCRFLRVNDPRQIVEETVGWEKATWDPQTWEALQQAKKQLGR